MIPTGILHQPLGTPRPADQVTTFLLTGGSSTQASDWLSTGSTAMANAGTGGIAIIRVTPLTTALSGSYGVVVNLKSTSAGAPASGTSIASSGVNTPVTQPAFFQVPGDSTGFSVFGHSAGLCMIEQWKR